MNLNPRHFFIMLSCIFLLCLAWGYISTHSGTRVFKPRYTNSYNALENTGMARHFVAMHLTLVAKINANHGLRHPIAMTVGQSGVVYILDWSDFKVKSFSANGNFQHVYGAGKGINVDQFLNPTDVAVAHHYIWISDPRLDKIVGFPIKKGKIKWLHITGAPERVLGINHKLFILLGNGMQGKLFELCNLIGHCGKPFGVFIRRQDRYGIAVDGWIASDPKMPALFYSGMRMGLFTSYTINGHIRFVAATINHKPLPTLESSTSGLITFANPRQTASLGLNAYQGRVYILSEIGFGGRAGQRIIDVYNEMNGRYEFSIHAPGQCNQTIISSLLYCLSPRKVTIWNWAIPYSQTDVVKN